jgi:putative tricarboxylic transport membrane protein
MGNMAKADRISGVVALLFSLAVISMALKMPMYAEFGPGAAFLPFWLAVLMGFLSILLFLNAGRHRGEHEEGSTLPTRAGALRSLIAFSLLIAYVWLLGEDRMGFLLATILAIGFLLRVLGRETWRTTILVAVLGALGLLLLFTQLLGVTLPSSIIGSLLGLPSGL